MLPYTNSNVVGYGDDESAICPACAVERYGARLVERVRLGLSHDSDLQGISAFDLLDGARCAECDEFFPTIRQANGLDSTDSV